MPPLHKALLFCSIVGGLTLTLLVGYLFFRSLTPASDASLARIPDIVQEAWRKQTRSAVEAKQRAREASRECVANGDRYCLMENYPAALREYSKALDLDGTNLHAALEVGRVGWHLKNRLVARTGWQKAITLDPLAAAAHAGLFEMLKEGDEQDVRRAFRHAITLRVLAPYRAAAREFVLLNPELAREIELVGDDAGTPPAETDARVLLSKAWQALPKHDARTADICFARVLALLKEQDAKKL
jgi:tetratricopeptide (TPR) repeat protein